MSSFNRVCNRLTPTRNRCAANSTWPIRHASKPNSSSTTRVAPKPQNATLLKQEQHLRKLVAEQDGADHESQGKLLVEAREPARPSAER